MGRRGTSVWLTGLLGVSLLTGCTSSMGRHSWSEDPLVQSKKPVNRPVETTGPVFASQVQPETAPAAPLAALGIDQPARLVETAHDSTPFRLIDSSHGPLPVLPAARTKVVEQQRADAPIQRQVPGTYGHAPDYAWLQGVLARDYRGRLELRYCAWSVDDRWGGKVYLDTDPRLQHFRDSDLIVVRGMLKISRPPAAEDWYYPHYQISAILLLHRPS